MNAKERRSLFDLILGNDYGKGTVTLTNMENSFSGKIYFNGAITLNYTDTKALGNARIQLGYATRIPAFTSFNNLEEGAKGVLLLKAGDNANPASIDLTAQTSINIGTDEVVTYNGDITLATGAAYHFGGGSGTLTINSDLSSGHDLIIDGQTYSGGTVILKNLQTLNNGGSSITIMGYSEENATVKEGNATLKLQEGQQFNTNQQITLKDGGILDLAGTSQTFAHLSMAEGSLLTDSSEGTSSSIILTTSDTLTLLGDMDISAITKEGTGTVELGGSNQYQSFTASSGTVKLMTDTALASGEATFRQGSTLIFNNHIVGGNIQLDGAQADATAGGGISADGMLIAISNGAAIHTATGKIFTVAGSIGAEAGVTLQLSGTYALLGETINAQGGKLEFTDASTLTLGSGTQSFGGTISLKSGSSITNSGSGATYVFDTLHIDSSNGGGDVSLTTGSFRSWNSSSWTINHLTGSGTLSWNPKNYHHSAVSSTINFAGEGDFAGSVKLHGAPNTWQPLARYAQLSHDKALQNASIELIGPTTKQQIALAINTENAHIKGINGADGNSHIYAGVAGGSASSVPTSSRTATLTFTAGEEENYIFAGTVGLNDASTSNGISLAMNGKGSQTFNGATVIVNDVTVLQGTLAFGGNTALTIRGDIALAQGGTLTIGANSGFTLNEGQTISILSQEGSTQGATFSTPTLTLNGGAFSFSADAFRGSCALAGIGSVQVAESITGLTIHLNDTNRLGTGTYTLASGDWSAAYNLNFTTTGLDYMNASYDATANGLTLTISTKEGNYIWNGTEAATSWNESQFGQMQGSPGEANTAIFNDVAESKDVQLNASAQVDKLLFDNSETYTLTGAEGKTITTGNITQRGTGKTSINAGVTAGTVLVEQGTLELQQAAAISQGIDIRNSGILSLASLSGENSLTLSMGKNATLAFTGDTPGTLTLNSLALETGGTITFDNAHITNNDATSDRLFLSDSTLRLLNGSVLDDRGNSYRLTNSEFTVEGNGTLYIKGFRLSNNSSTAPSTLTVAQGATLVVTGDTLGKDGAFALSHWETDGNSLRVAGTLTSNAAISSWDSSASITVLEGGVLNLLKGLSRDGDRSNGITLDVEKGGSLYAAGGNQNASLGLFLHAGSTLGAIRAIGDEVTFSNDMLLGTMQEAGTVTIQTNYSIAANDGSFAVTQGNDGGTINLTGNISSYIGTTLALTGNGIVNSQGTLAVGGGLQVQDSATLCVSGALSVLGDITVSDGASLRLQGATLASSLSLASGSLSISGDITMGAATSITNGGTISLAEGTTFHLSVEDINDASYTIISGTGSIIYEEDATPTFFINGLDATSWTDIMTVTRTGNELSFTLQGAGQYLTWNGSEATGTVWAIGNESLNWQTQGGDAAAYKSLAHVTFAEGGEHSVTVSGEVVAQQMDITAGAGETAWTFASSGEAAGAIEVWTDMSISRAAEASFGVDVAIGGGLTVEGNASFARALSVGSTIDVTGKLTLTADAATNGSFAYSLDASQGGTLSLDTQGKTLSYNSGSLKADTFLLTGGGSLNTNLEGLALDNVGIGENTTLTITHKYTHSPTGKTLGQVTLANGAKLAFYNPANAQKLSISSIVLQGDNATVTDGHYAGLYTIGSLSGSGNLCLAKGSDAPSATIYDIGTVPLEGDSFTGTLTVNNAAVSAYGTERPISLVISNGTITQNATISLTATQAAGATQIGLGLHDTTVRIAGLASQQNLGNRAAVYSGTASSDFKINNGIVSGISDMDTRRTLSIHTTKDASHTYYGQIGSNVNLNISGEGTQTFAGTSADFNGSITLNSGTLAFANAEAAAMLATTGGVNLNGGTLDLSGLKLTAGNTEAAISLKEGSSLTFGSGIKLNMGTLGYGTYWVFDSSHASAFTGWESLTKENITQTGDLSWSSKTSFSFKAGALTIEAPELVWNGGSSNNTWETGGVNWLADQTSVAFENYDMVRFADGDNLSKEVVVAAGGVNALDVTVEGTGFQFSGGGLNVKGSLNIAGTALFNNTLSVDGSVTVTGKLDLTAAAATNGSFAYSLDASQGGTLSLDTQGSALTYNAGSLKADTFLLTGGGSLNTNLEGLVLNKVEIGKNTTLTITNQTASSPTGKTLGKVTLENVAKLAFYNHKNAQNISIGSIVLQGDNATVTDGNFAGLYTIGSLSGSGNLCLAKGSASQTATVYYLGNPDTPKEDPFTGTLTLANTATSTNPRPLSLVISNGTITQNATISLTATQASTGTQIGLGLHDTTVRIAGLASQQNLGNRAAVYSGTASSDFKINNGTVSGISDAGTSRTLAINTAKGASHTYYGQIGSNVNLNISGEGTQTFAGTSADFNGSITLNSGTLAFANAEAAAMLATTGGVNLNGGTLDLSGLKLTAGNTEAAISLKEGSSLTFGSGIKLNMGTLGYGTYQLFDSGQEYSLINWGGLTENNIILDGQYSPKTSVTFDAKAGTLTIRAIELVWNGGSSNNTWVASGDNWLAGQNSAAFETDDVVRFVDGDNLSKEVVVADGGVNALDVTVEGTGFQFTGGELNVQDTLTIEQDASATFGNVTHVAKHLDVAGTAQFNNTLQVDGSVTVTGKLALTADAADNGSFSYKLDASQGGTLSLDTQGSNLTYNAGSLKADTFLLTGGGSLNTNLEGLVLNKVEIGSNTTLTITNQTATSGAGKTLGQITLDNGATFAIYDANQPTAFTEIGGICLKDGTTATFTDTYNSGYNRIASLSGSGTLNFTKQANSGFCSVYELGTTSAKVGSFSGTIGLSSAATGDKRSATLVISQGNIAENAVIAFGKTTATDDNTVLGLGIHADTVTIAGLESQPATGTRSMVYSGSFPYKKTWSLNNIADSVPRTLSINTTKGASHTYYGQIYSNVNLNISGEGTQTFAGDSADFNGSITLESGTLAFANAEAAAMLATTGGVNLNGGTLDLSALTLTAGSTSAAIALGENSFLTFGENIKLNLGALEDGTYTLFSGGNLEGWEKLTFANLVLSGHGQATFHQGGSVTLSGLEHYTLVWDASKPSGTWESSTANWKHGESSSNFANGDSVTFASTAAVAVVDDVQADTVTVEAGAELTLTREEAATLSMNTLHIEGTLKTAFGLSVGEVSSTEGSEWQLLDGAEQDLAKDQLDGVRHLHVAKGATLAVSDKTMAGFTLGKNTRLTGEGTVALHLSAAYANTVHTGSEFNGTTYVQAGNMTLDGSAVGSALKLADGSHAQLSSSSTEATAFGQNLILEGTSEINQNGRDLTMSGEVSGEGTYKHTGGGKLTFKGNVDLGGFSVDNTVASATTFAGDRTTVGDVSLIPSEGSSEQATVDFAGARTTISGTLSIGAGENQVSLAGTTIKAGSDSAATISGATTTALTEQGQTKLTIQGKDQGNISNAIMELAEGSSLELADVRITGNSLLSADTLASLTVHRATIELPETTTGEKSTTTSSMELTLTGSGETYTVAEGATVYTLTSSALQKMSLSGTSLCFDLSNLTLDLSSYDLLCISLEGSGSELTGLDGLTVSATRGMSRSAGLMTGYYETGVTSSPVIYFDLSGAAVPTPEPTTTTLGLLALSALAARRRRKAR